MARPSQAILGPLLGIIQDMYLNDSHKGREAFAKLKQLLRKAAARSKEALVEAIGAALSAITTADAKGFFEHAGYRPAGQLP
jgi:hypothetical protein